MSLNRAEIDYIRTQPIGRLATVDANGRAQNSPVGFAYDEGTGVIDIGGMHMGDTRKFRNVAGTGTASLVIDDIVSLDPWRVRMVEIRGTAEALTGVVREAGSYMSPEVIRIHPTRVISYGLDEPLGADDVPDVTP